MNHRNRLAAAVCAAVLAVPAHAATVSDWTPLFIGVDTAVGTAVETSAAGAPVPQRAVALRFDLDAPGLGFLATPSNGDEPLEVTAQTTGQFLESNDLQVAMNATFFAPCCAPANEPKDNLGLVISEGAIVSPAEPAILPQTGLPFTSLVLTPDNAASFVAQEAVAGPVDTAVSGSLLLLDGAILVDEVPADGFANFNPRSAVGVSADGDFMYWVVIDGRNPGVSEGATLFQTAEWLQRFGADDGLNLDGGGSSTLVAADATGAATLLNRPSTFGFQRFNGVNIGATAAPLAPVPLPPAAALLAGAMALLAMARRRVRA